MMTSIDPDSRNTLAGTTESPSLVTLAQSSASLLRILAPPAMVTYPNPCYVSEGFYRNRWAQCHWCWKWGMSLWPPVLPTNVLPLWNVDGVGYLCDHCLALDEPPWQPNARQRCAQALRWIMPANLRGNAAVLAVMSTFMVWNDP